MHSHSVERWSHDHAFLGDAHARNERRTGLVVLLTGAAMVAEIAGGTIFRSMALVADGWHMSTHAAALGIATLAYRYARRHAHDPRFTFGTGKLGELAAFASALILAMIALAIGYESLTRLMHPVAIAFGEAIPIAALGLVVNIASVWLLHGGGDHAHGHSHGDHHHDGHGHHHDHHGGDSNMRAAYLHVFADALTSVLAIVALTCGLAFGWAWLDPAMGLVGTMVILAWSASLIRSAGAVLLDIRPSETLSTEIRRAIEVDGDRLADLHAWRLGPGHTGVILSVVSDRPLSPGAYKSRLAGIGGLSHVTVEVHACGGALATC